MPLKISSPAPIYMQNLGYYDGYIPITTTLWGISIHTEKRGRKPGLVKTKTELSKKLQKYFTPR